MKKRETGRYVIISTVGEKCQAFVPHPLPPKPPIKWTSEFREEFDNALLAIGRLDGFSNLLPDPYLYNYIYIRKEAVLSSQIEGTQSSLSDLLQHESGHIPGVPLDDVIEVSNYVAAFNFGIKMIKQGMPISLRLLKEMHGILLQGGRGSSKSPGEFRTSQNWIGGTRPGNAAHVPPPPNELINCLGDLEKFINDVPVKTPALLKAGLAHAQFETIHPFLDGNGRIGRLLITLMLMSDKVLTEPMLYLSLYFKQNRQEYYERLQKVRTEGNWEGWLEYFAKAVTYTSEQAVVTAKSLSQLVETDISTLRGKKYSSNLLMVLEALSKKVICDASALIHSTNISKPTVYSALRHLTELGIVSEETVDQQGKMFVYTGYLQILNNELG